MKSVPGVHAPSAPGARSPAGVTRAGLVSRVTWVVNEGGTAPSWARCAQAALSARGPLLAARLAHTLHRIAKARRGGAVAAPPTEARGLWSPRVPTRCPAPLTSRGSSQRRRAQTAAPQEKRPQLTRHVWPPQRPARPTQRGRGLPPVRRGDVTIRAGLPGPLPAPVAGPRHPWRGRSLPTRGQSGLGAGTSVTFCRVVKGDGPCLLGCPRPSPTYGASVCASVSEQILAPTRKGVRRWRPRTAVNSCGVWELQAAGPPRRQSVSSSRGGQSGTGRLQVDKSTRNDLGSTPHQQNGAPSPCWESRSPESVPSGAWTPLRRRQGTCQGTLPAENMDEPQVPGLSN